MTAGSVGRRRRLVVLLAVLALPACAQASVASRPGPVPDPSTPSTPTTPTTPPYDDVVSPPGGVFARSSIWREDVRDASVDPASPAQVRRLTESLGRLYGGVAAFNVYQYGMSWYSVDQDVPEITLQFDNCQNKPRTPPGLYGPGGQFEAVPLPSGARTTPGTDASIAIYRESTDTLWALWKAYESKGGWRACWGGRIDDVSTSTGAFPVPYGASASGLAREAGAVTINDVRGGVIEHAVALSLPADVLAAWFVPPATRTDGAITDADAIPEGTRLRLDPTLDVATLGLTPIAAMVAEAAQTYGFVITDRSGTVSIPVEGPWAVQAATGTDPWVELLGGLSPGRVLVGFPWDRVEVLQATS